MSKIATATFKGKKASYSFEVYSSDTLFNDVGAVYIFTKRVVKDGSGTHSLIYIGESEELGSRIADHEKWACAEKHDVNCICVHLESDYSKRITIESDLIANNSTPCNQQ